MPLSKIESSGLGLTSGNLNIGSGNGDPYGGKLSLTNSGQASAFFWNQGVGSGHVGVAAGSSNLKLYNTYATGLLSDGKGIDIDTAGRVLMPNQPYFHYNTLNSTTLTNGAQVPKYTNAVTANAAYSTTTGYYTAPVTGVYVFSWCYLMQSIDTGISIDDGWILNGNFVYGGERRIASSPNTWGDGYYPVKQTVVLKLNAGDYFAPRSNHGDVSWAFYGGGTWGHISGTLIG